MLVIAIGSLVFVWCLIQQCWASCGVFIFAGVVCRQSMFLVHMLA